MHQVCIDELTDARLLVPLVVSVRVLILNKLAGCGNNRVCGHLQRKNHLDNFFADLGLFLGNSTVFLLKLHVVFPKSKEALDHLERFLLGEIF